MSESLRQIRYQGTDHLPGEPALDVQNLSVTYPSLGAVTSRTSGDLSALQDVSFRVDAGERIAIIGPNGAGKSTLLQVLAGLIKPDAGRVLMYGHEPDRHICIAYVGQRSQVDWSFPASVEDVVMMGRTRQIGLFRRPGARDWQIVHESLSRVNALDLAKKQIGELSGGQQQRVFIARAMALETNLLLLDEPLTGLDIPAQDAILDILDAMSAEGVTTLVATHDLGLAIERFDRVLLLNCHVVALGPPESVLSGENLVHAFRGPVRPVARANGLDS